MGRRRDSDKGRLPPFVPLLVTTLNSQAWKALSHGAKVLYVALKRRVPKDRNRAYLSYRDAEAELRSSRRKIRDWFRELEHFGFIVLLQHGSLGVEGKGKSPHWRLTELGTISKASATGLLENPTCDFLKWDGTPFRHQREARTPGAYGCKKQNPSSYVGNGAVPTGETEVFPTGAPPKSECGSDGVAIENGKSVSDGVAITSLTTRGAAKSSSELSELAGQPQAVDARILCLADWGIAGQRKRFDEICARFDALHDPRVSHFRRVTQ